VQDCVRELKKVSKFLGLDCSDDLLDAISAKCSFSVMAAEKLKSEAGVLKFMSKDANVHRSTGNVSSWRVAKRTGRIYWYITSIRNAIALYYVISIVIWLILFLEIFSI
jgi:hypothetical protein